MWFLIHDTVLLMSFVFLLSSLFFLFSSLLQVDAGQQAMIDAGIYGPEGHPMSRPEATEAEATHRAIAIADQVGVPLYVVHVMSKAACQEIERAKEKGINVYGEPLAVALACDGREMYNPDWRHAAG